MTDPASRVRYLEFLADGVGDGELVEDGETLAVGRVLLLLSCVLDDPSRNHILRAELHLRGVVALHLVISMVTVHLISPVTGIMVVSLVPHLVQVSAPVGHGAALGAEGRGPHVGELLEGRGRHRGGARSVRVQHGVVEGGVSEQARQVLILQRKVEVEVGVDVGGGVGGGVGGRVGGRGSGRLRGRTVRMRNIIYIFLT